MPLYEYQCQQCREKIEIIQKFSDEPSTICPSCGGALKKLISSPAIKFKGSGFYITDYAKAGSSEAGSRTKTSGDSAASSEGSSASSSTATESKSESKNESKSETKSESSSSETKSASSKSESKGGSSE